MVVYEILDSRQIKRHLLKKLANEWRDDPSGPADIALIKRCKWNTKMLGRQQITLAEDVVTDPHFIESLKERVQTQMLLIQDERPISPLVIIGENRLLVDGYARFFALEKLGASEITTYWGRETASRRRHSDS